MEEETQIEETDADRHRRERRELQAAVQQLKKSVNKNDKTRKKKVDAEIRALEEAFEKKWANFNENDPTATATASASVSAETPVINADAETSAESTAQVHVSRKARRLANKEKREAEARANEEVIDYENHPDVIRCRDESSSIESQLTERGLELHSVVADGNCLFASIVDQTGDLNIRQLRKIVADYLRDHREEFQPFIESDYDLYCSKMEKDNVWGGQIELQACTQLLQRSIEVIQGNGKEPIVIQCPNPKAKPIVITYHRYLFSNGEHYNSTRARENHDDE